MSTLPTGFAQLTLAFAPLFSKRVFQRVKVLLFGAILAIGKRTVTSVLRVMGLDQQAHFQTYHRALSRAAWSPLAASRILLRLLVRAFAPHGPLVFGLDGPLERRWGARIAARGIYRDPVRSSRSHFVKVSGLRWLCMMLLVPIPRAAGSERCLFHRPVPVRTLSRAAWQMAQDADRLGAPDDQASPTLAAATARFIVADSAFAALDFFDATRQHATIITACAWMPPCMRPHRFAVPVNEDVPAKKGERLPASSQVLADPRTQWTSLTARFWYGEQNRVLQVASETALWYHSGMPVIALRRGLIRDPLGQFETQALLCTDVQATPAVS
jgi:hypothetical protein